LLKLIHRREQLVQKRLEHFELMRDPEYQELRLGRQKGAHLLRERVEKLEAAIKKIAPITEKLKKELSQWEKLRAEAFEFKGKDYLEILVCFSLLQ